jgi:hypothetical protein
MTKRSDYVDRLGKALAGNIKYFATPSSSSLPLLGFTFSHNSSLHSQVVNQSSPSPGWNYATPLIWSGGARIPTFCSFLLLDLVRTNDSYWLALTTGISKAKPTYLPVKLESTLPFCGTLALFTHGVCPFLWNPSSVKRKIGLRGFKKVKPYVPQFYLLSHSSLKRYTLAKLGLRTYSVFHIWYIYWLIIERQREVSVIPPHRII